jgi:hypothetical protein
MNKPHKPKSPPTPSRPLGDAVADVEKLHGEYSRQKFTKPEIASTLGLSATSGPFAARLFTLRAFGLIKQDGSDYSVSDQFMTLKSMNPGDAKFKHAALSAIRASDTFRELLVEFGDKLPSTGAVAERLETKKAFNAAPAKTAATVLEKSLRYAGVLDNSNNILPVRAGAENGAGSTGGSPPVGEGDQGREEEQLHRDILSMEIPVGDDRKVLIRYPRDISSDEAKKVGNVLAAVVG